MATNVEPESYSHRVSPSVYGQRFDTALRKKATPNIFEAVSPSALQRLFERSGDKKAEERARIISTNQDSEEITRALVALKLRKKMKLMQLFRIGRKSMKILSSSR